MKVERTAAGTTQMYREASEAAASVAAQWDRNADIFDHIGKELQRRNPGVVLTIARGSSDHAATYSKYLIESVTGVTVSSYAPSLTSVYDVKPALKGAAAIAISQSGQSPDIVAAAAAAKAAGALLIALVNNTASPLADAADIVVPLHAAPETSVAATKSFIASLAAVARIVAAWNAEAPFKADLNRLPKRLEEAWALDWSGFMPPLAARRNLFVIARGVGLAAAQEAALKFKETCRLHAEAYSAAEVLHGPAAIIDHGFPVLTFAQHDAALNGLLETTDKLSAMGAEVLLAGASHPNARALPCVNIHPLLQPITTIQTFYRLANELAVALDLSPDKPPNLNKVTETV